MEMKEFVKILQSHFQQLSDDLKSRMKDDKCRMKNITASVVSHAVYNQTCVNSNTLANDSEYT
jgi:hypothetical protein